MTRALCWTALSVLALLSLVLPRQAEAQVLGASDAPGGPELPRWLTAWSPLAAVADLHRSLPGSEVSLPSLLTVPAPRVGSFWSAGNPGALPFENSDAYAQIRTGYKRYSGEYRRPLDAGRESFTGGSAFGWKALESGGSAIGNVVVDRLRRSRNGHADVVLPFSSNPFTVLDTLGDAISTTVMRLEGSGGWRLGNLGVGVSLGFEGREVRTEESPVPRQDRVSATGVTAGLAYDVADGMFRLGVFGRRTQMTQYLYMYGYADNSLAYVLSGYYDPLPFELSLWSAGRIERRMEQGAWAYGFSVGGKVAGVSWVGFALADRVMEEQFLDLLTDEPETDDWEADGWTLGFAAQRLFGERRILVTVSTRYAQLAGETLRLDLDEVNFTAKEHTFHITGEVRLLPWNGWGGAAQLALGSEGRERHDLLARVGSNLHHRAPAMSLEVSRTLPRGFAISVAGGLTLFSPWGDIPTPNNMSEAYRDWIAPELSLYGTEAWTKTGALTILWHARDRLSIWAQGMLATLTPRTSTVQLEYRPEGTRTSSRIQLGVTMGGGAKGR